MPRGNVQAMRDALDARGIELTWADIDAAVAAYDSGRGEPEYEYGIGWVGDRERAWSYKADAEEALESVRRHNESTSTDRPYVALRRIKGQAPGEWEKFDEDRQVH